jgi:hypothetical protein
MTSAALHGTLSRTLRSFDEAQNTDHKTAAEICEQLVYALRLHGFNHMTKCPDRNLRMTRRLFHYSLGRLHSTELSVSLLRYTNSFQNCHLSLSLG